MAQDYGRNHGRKCLATLAMLAAFAAPSSAFAAQSEVMIEQLDQGYGWALSTVGQIVSATAGNAFVAQAQPAKTSLDSAFQVNLGALSFAQAASTEQLSQELSSTGAGAELAFLGVSLDLGRRSGARSSNAQDASGNVLQQEWRGEGNVQFASQQGAGNRAVQQQYGGNNVAVLIQRGDHNVGEILQLSNQGVAALLQNGDRNVATIVQGSAGSFASVSQSGIANIVAIRQ